MSPGTSTHHATIHAATLGFDCLEELADATSGWEFDWRQLDRGPLRASLMQVEAPYTLVSQFRTNRKFHQRGVVPPGMRTFGIVGVRSSPVGWNGREWSKNQIEVFPSTDLYEAVRLEGVRRDLRRLGPRSAIADIANTWGFWHLGQFAADYRRQFDELPSETLAHTHPATR